MNNSNPYSTSHDETSASEESAASQVERLSTACSHALRDHDFDFISTPDAQEFLSRIAPDFKAQLDTYAADAQHVTWPRQVEMWKKRARENPGVRFHITNISSDVDEKKGVASVFMHLEVEGLANATLQAINELKWRRTRGEWLCYYIIGLRASPAILTFPGT